MELSQRTIGQRIARVVRNFEQRHTQHGREWATVFLNEETIVIAIHRSLTDAERVPEGNRAGHSQLSEHLQRVFAGTALVQKIQRVSGMVVRNTTVEIEPATGGVVLLFTTDTAMDFPLPPDRPARVRMPGRSPLERPDSGTRRTKTTGRVVRD